MENSVGRILREGTILGFANHTVLVASDGTEIPIDDRGAVIRDENGEILGAVFVFRDITERRRAEAISRLLASIVESSDDAIISKDTRGIITSWNKGAEKIFGYTAGEVVGKPISIIAAPDRVDEMPRILARILHGERIDHYETVRRAKSGKLVNISLTVSPLYDAEGRIVGASKIARDITEQVNTRAERKALQDQLLQAQKMEAIGRLAGGIAHDFNNMLTVISGYNRMILEGLPAMDPSRQYAEEILEAAERAGALTNQLLSFSRRQIIQPRVIRVNAVVEQSEKMLQRVLGDDIQLVCELKRDAGNIRADPNQIVQAIVNLAVNARDAMPTGGRLLMETANVFLDETYVQTHLDVQPGEFVMIAMSDTGCGMEAATQEHIFEPFFTTKEQGKGTGLGLATVYGMMKQTGGDIWVYSEVGRGTTFKLYFPRVFTEVSELARGGPQVQAGGGETVLVVEDDQAVRDLTVRMLNQLGYVVLAAVSGVEALAISKSYAGRISILVTDVLMPHMSGRQVADDLLRTRPDMKVLYLSGYPESMVIHHGVLDSAVEFLPKPFSREALGQKVREVLGKPASNR
ncbi:MAG TPA: PAS domain S-box protein [Bryobacteraceae bacterium]|nr:PAS domain S-box protein [Bryobacteraceae bacterium]